MIKVIKRDGRSKEYSTERIEKAIRSAYVEVYGDELKFKEDIIVLIHLIDRKVRKSNKDIEVEVVQDIIVDYLTQCDEVVAKAYQEYRTSRNIARESKLEFVNSIVGLVDQTNEEVMNENSNKNSALASTQRDLVAGEASKYIAKTQIIPTHIVYAHDEGVLHYHDMDYAIQKIHNCMLINLEDMFENGTVINNKLVERPKSFGTACTVTTQIIAQIASGQHGGNSITIKHIAPFLRVSYDKYYNKYKVKYSEEMTKELAEERMMEELKSGIQTIRYQLSTLHTSNGSL